VAPAAVPQRWQNFAPGDSGAAHEPHVAPAKGVPQFEQNLPVDAAPHDGHWVVASGAVLGEAMG
jgi:hypothetical protein